MSKFLEQTSLYDGQEDKEKRHTAIILQILTHTPTGLTLEQIREKEVFLAGYSFYTSKFLRALQRRGLIEAYGRDPQRWRPRAP